jgi:serine/threonine protein kinase
LNGNGGRWVLGERIGGGSFGSVYNCSRAAGSAPSGSADDSAVQYAAKIAPLAAVPQKGVKIKKGSQSVESGLVYTEYLLYTQHLGEHPNLPVIPRNGYGEDATNRWLVMQKMKGTLRSYVDAAGGVLPWSTTCNIMLQLLSVLAHIHSKGLVYQDINLDNIMVGTAPAAASVAGSMTVTASQSMSTPSVLTVPVHTERIFLIDFGLAVRYKNYDGSFKPAVPNGTPMFASIAHAKGGVMAPLNDLECVGYLLLYLVKGRAAIPWVDATSEEQVVAAKKKATIPQLCAGIAQAGVEKAVRSFLLKVSQLSATGDIPYDALQKIFLPDAAPDGALVFRASAAAKASKASKASKKDAETSASAAAPAPAPAAKSKATKMTKGPVVVEVSDDEEAPASRGKSAAAKASSPAATKGKLAAATTSRGKSASSAAAAESIAASSSAKVKSPSAAPTLSGVKRAREEAKPSPLAPPPKRQAAATAATSPATANAASLTGTLGAVLTDFGSTIQRALRR